MTATMIQASPVVRDKDGWWSHPDIPEFDEGDEAKYRQWVSDQGLTTFYRMLEDESDEHPAYVSYFDNADPDVSAWNPEPPFGDGWFPLSIHDTEDGPIFVWATRVPAGAA